MQKFPKCDGFIHWDPQAEEQWGLGVIEVMICEKCTYRSNKYKLFMEIEDGKPGRKAACMNRSLQVGLTQTPIGPTSLRRLLMSVHVPPPSRSAMQESANQVCDDIEAANVLDMHGRREQLKKVNRLRGDAENVIDIECDGVYNNKLSSGVGRTPFQPGLQCNYVVVENVTNKREIIAMENVNKLCSKHGMHTASDHPCDIKSGECSSTDTMETSIGNEKEWAARCLTDLHSSGLEVHHITTDADTKAFKAAQELYEKGVTATKPEHQLDSRHLCDNHRKYIKSNTEFLTLMPGKTKAEREINLGTFALDLSKRCQSECEQLNIKTKQCDGVSTFTQRDLSLLTEYITMCYYGDHSLCELHSLVCKGTETENWKVESVNRTLRRSLTTNVTYPRNFAGRSHSAVHSRNYGPGESLTRLMETEGCSVLKGSRVASSLKKEQQCYDKGKLYSKSTVRKVKRLKTRTKLYDLHRKHRYEVHYRKSQLLQ
ncbi:hypothetical protein FSP39_014462 [Pinctada imbricata]|uniref:Mutator-like transposase domain-containing protein n=1 Tax=Pinctada imbricata TaxID=66713 RepID=A0AA88YHG8_PINIB|nr:hypothetical protein FSP39_014462 [Pinctada imbricata]